MVQETLKIHELAEQILMHKRAYYSGKPIISDADFDRLEDQLRKLSPDHPALLQVGSNEGFVGGKVEHARPMLSLEKTYVQADLMKWCDGKKVVGTLKLDGASLSLIYRSGKLHIAKTRGNGRVGEDVSDKARWISNLPLAISTRGEVEIRGEICCSEESFIKLGNELVAAGEERPTSPRNIVAGTLGRKSMVENARYFSFLAFDVDALDDSFSFKTESEKIEWLKRHGFTLPVTRAVETEKEVEGFLEAARLLMDEGDYGLDGAVFTYDDVAMQQELGVTSHHPRFKIAFKWAGETAETKINRIEWATSRLGIVTPVAVIEPVHLSNAEITNVTLHNASIVKAFDLKSGDKIEIIRSGEVIPKFLRVVEAGKGSVALPDSCPSCGFKLDFDDVRLKCGNQQGCPAQIMRTILNWISVVEIEDLSEKRLTQMLERGLVKAIPDLYQLTEEQLLSLPATKEKMASKLLANIEKTKSLDLAVFLHGLGIEGAGRTSWEKLLEHFRDMAALQSATEADIAKVDGFAETSAKQICQGLRSKKSLIEALQAVGVRWSIAASSSGAGVLSGMTFVITGALSQPRAAVEKQIKAAGGKLGSAVSSATTALITNETDSTSSKMIKAKKLGIPVWNEAELTRRLE
jgi:DNA ligase (NAD+)